MDGGDAGIALGRLLIAVGALLVALGALLVLAPSWPGVERIAAALERMPGTLRVERPGLRIWFPLGACIALSVGLSLAWWLLGRWR